MVTVCHERPFCCVVRLTVPGNEQNTRLDAAEIVGLTERAQIRFVVGTSPAAWVYVVDLEPRPCPTMGAIGTAIFALVARPGEHTIPDRSRNRTGPVTPFLVRPRG